MKKGINGWAFPPKNDGSPIDPVSAMRQAKELGYDCFEVTIEERGAVSLETTEEEASRIRREAERIGIELTTAASGLAWGTSPSDPDPKVRERALANTKRALEVCAWLGVRSLLYLPGMVSAVFIPGFKPQGYETVDRLAREAIRSLLPLAERLKVTLAVENVWNRFLLGPTEMRAFIDSFGSPNVGSYFDVGNVMLYGHPEDWIRTLATRIAAVHLKDFRVAVGNLEGFVDLLSGDVDFASVMAAFRSIGYSGTYTAEIVPGRLGAAEKAIAAIRLIERL